MLISNDHRFIFVHIPKTAGLSVAEALQPYALNNPRVGFRRLLSKLPVPEDPEKVAFPHHATARWARLKLPAQVFDGYFKFAVVRNPYDRAVSYFHYLTQNTKHHRHQQLRGMDFSQYLRYVAARRRDGTQNGVVADRNGRLLVDRILRIETLDAEFADLCSELKLPDQIRLPHRNHSERGDYQDYYRDDGIRKQVAALFAVDFEMFGYALDPSVREAVSPPKFNQKEFEAPLLAQSRVKADA